jgi:hypothetical protein
MKLADQWRQIRAELPEDWHEARLDVAVPRAEQRPRAAALLGPATPGRAGESLRVSVHRGGGGVGPDAVDRLFGRLDSERIRATVSLLGTDVRERAEPVVAPRGSAVGAWDAAVAALPPDWSDLLCEVELTSTDHVDQSALLLAPVNPYRVPQRAALRFRVARSFGYGASPEMTRRCLARLDEAGIPARPTVLRALSDTDNVATQGPVWRVGGKAV